MLTEEIAVEVTRVVGVSPALWYFRYIASIFLTPHKRLDFVWGGFEAGAILLNIGEILSAI
jgi:hypothetical protein